MFDRNDKLDIFENFVVDRSLPKYRAPPVAAPGSMSTGITIMNSVSSLMFNSSANGSVDSWKESKKGLFSRLWRWFAGWFHEARQMPIDSFFRSVKNSVEELQVVDHRLNGYLSAITQARKNGQTALAEQLETSVEGVRGETQLAAMNLCKYVTEAQLVVFVKKAKKGLRLDWMKNFARIVPDNVIKAKEAADERGVFDNYVVLHYDPQKKAWAETKDEIEKRKDPILFGVLRGRRRLYFVGDWVDPYCSLTFDELADVLGEPPREVSRDFETKSEDSEESWKGRSL